MEVDLSGFCAQLEQAEPEQDVSAQGVSPYLLEHLLTPYLEDMEIRCEDLDYDAFTMRDFVVLEEYLEQQEQKSMRVDSLKHRLCNTKPAVRKAPVFC